jgi:hypothetical protein
MRVSQAVTWSVLLAVAASAAACGAAQREPAAAAPVVVAPEPQEKSVTPEVPATPAPAPPPPPAAMGAAAAPQPMMAEAPAVGGGLSVARSELALAERQLQTSAGDCATACRALGSMERATAHLCAMASSSDDQRSCQDARAKVLGGRDRVRASCGECPGGPSLDKNAPIPSTR